MWPKRSKLMQQLAGDWSPVLAFMLFDDNGTGDEGGGDVGGGEGGEHTEERTPTEGEDTGRRAAGDTGGTGPMIPKTRFDEVNRQLQAFKQFGTPEQVKALKDRIAWMEKNPGKKYNDQEVSDIERELRQVPALQRMFAMADRYEQQEQRQAKRYTSYGDRLTDKFLGELGRTPDDKNRAALSHALVGVIQSDPEMLERFFALDQEVFADAFKQFKLNIFGNAGIKRPVPGADVQRLKQPAPKPGQKTDGKKPPANNQQEKTDRDILDEANDAAYEALLAAGESN